jgi:glutathionyl-hydroquinone reductase
LKRITRVAGSGCATEIESDRIRSQFFRSWITADGSSRFKVEPDRYHLYVSYAYPFALQTISMRCLKKLENIVSMSVANLRCSGDGEARPAQTTLL